jgi:hypothetical protein
MRVQDQVRSDSHYTQLYSPMNGTTKISGSLCKLIDKQRRPLLKDSHKLTPFQIKLYYIVISYNKRGNSSAFRCLISIYRSIVYYKE